MRVAAVEKARGGGLGEIARLILQLQGRIIQKLANLKAACTKRHFDIIAAELDLEALDVYFVHTGRPRDSLWTIAALAPDVIALEALHPYLTWCHVENIELTLPRIEQDVGQISQALERFEAHVGQVHEQIER